METVLISLLPYIIGIAVSPIQIIISLLLLLILIRILMPERSKYFLTNLSGWLTQHSRSITIAVAIVFGLYFLRSGISGLLA
ncbi:hypothetical protein [Myxacorys almedinensis]|uniref:Uncharacterized protein n=1 Tax=Myxacorys almedinensis A TaxID=2690445 RepID=A0A8J7Z9P4_9CYAN|nr:hypothetical protein [Myxacorys almedinensis]NDJ17985.1 hypothetical protein [Myxacorys almedinensis A]